MTKLDIYFKAKAIFGITGGLKTNVLNVLFEEISEKFREK